MLDKVMKGNRGYLTDPKEAVRYFEDDEIDERSNPCLLYPYLVLNCS
jgi:hypothetical protein